jgi:hypothetical protein
MVFNMNKWVLMLKGLIETPGKQEMLCGNIPYFCC